jgi:hypothetical protein
VIVAALLAVSRKRDEPSRMQDYTSCIETILNKNSEGSDLNRAALAAQFLRTQKQKGE